MPTMRDFSRRLAEFKRMAAAGQRVRIVDRQGKKFIFEALKPSRAYGAGKHLAKGKALSPERIPPGEWKDME